MSDKKKRRRLGAGIAVGAAVAAALLTLLLAGAAGLSGGHSETGPVVGWVRDVQDGLAKRGYRWIDIDVTDTVATVSGEAPDVDSRRYGFEAAEAAIQEASKEIAVVVDATTLPGGEASVGAAIKALGATPAALDCQTAFQGTLAGRVINFTPGSAELTPDNKRLLDALSAVAIRCKAYAIEIGGHTDASGSPRLNLALSRNRAASVEAYLRGKGVPEGVLTTRGYGSSKPVDPAPTPEAAARNRRIEFTVAAR